MGTVFAAILGDDDAVLAGGDEVLGADGDVRVFVRSITACRTLGIGDEDIRGGDSAAAIVFSVVAWRHGHHTRNNKKKKDRLSITKINNKWYIVPSKGSIIAKFQEKVKTLRDHLTTFCYKLILHCMHTWFLLLRRWL